MIELPKLFEQTLSKKPSLHADVRKTLDAFEPWLEQSGMPFFPGFTDHSPRHINDVLKTAAALISDASHSLLSSEDVAVLCIAVLLHDCGMHLTQDGFRTLIATKSTPIVSGLTDKPWNSLWIEFLAEARRFGEDRLLAIFGDATPISTTDFDPTNLSERGLLLGGEFIRRNHARLAHEIAIGGVPMKGGKPLTLIGFETDLKDIAGLVARSHGMAIRQTFPYLNQKYGRISEYRSIKTPFLMAIIRIADYVQVQSERALKSLLSVKELRSPVSRQEWRNHFAVSDVTLRHEDPEAMYVHAQPTDVKTFIRLEALFFDIQRELDASWAALGEVYGRLGELSALGLTIRRIRSNLDDKEKFGTTVSYVPINAGFQSSGPDLLKLLVGPLYDYKYSVGLRELIQNSVDACKELSDLKKIHAPRETHEPDVLVEIQEAEDGTGWITVTDNGVGMTLDTVVNYFLVAGASFRNSDVWKRQHVSEEGSVRVIRGGRFGVGALAAFLLGDEIRVRTRHFGRDELSGVEFTARIDEPLVELRRCSAKAGTSITVRVTNSDVMKALRPFINSSNTSTTPDQLNSWPNVDWYRQTEPSISYRWSGYEIESDDSLKTKSKRTITFVPNEGLTPNSSNDHIGWHSIDEPHPYEAILWKYPSAEKRVSEKFEYSINPAKKIVVNGITIEDFNQYSSHSTLAQRASDFWISPSHSIDRPSLAIYDPLGVCPVNLQRSSVSFERMGKDIAIGKSVLEHYVKKVQELLPERLTIQSFLDFLHKVNELPGVRYRGRSISSMCLTQKGIFFPFEQAFSGLGIRKVFFVQGHDFPDSSISISKLLKKDEALFLSPPLTGDQAKLIWFRAVFGDPDYTYRLLEAGFPLLPHTLECGVLSTEMWSLTSKKGKVNKTLIGKVEVISKYKTHVTVASGAFNHLETLKQRLDDLHGVFGSKTEVGGWIVEKEIDMDSRVSASPLVDIWTSLNNGIHLRNPYSKALSNE
jgi:hypothetical protein